MYKFKLKIMYVYALLLFIIVGYSAPSCAKGFMAIKTSLGYQHERPENTMGPAVAKSDKRNFIANYGLTTNPYGSYNSIENAQSYSALDNGNGIEYTNGLDEIPVVQDEGVPIAKDIEQQTLAVVDHPYDHELD